MRDLYASGVYSPDPVPLNSVILKTNYLGGRIGIISTGWISYAIEFWDPALKLNPPMRPRVLPPFDANGGEPIWHQTQGTSPGMMVLKKGTAGAHEGTIADSGLLVGPVWEPRSAIDQLWREGH